MATAILRPNGDVDAVWIISSGTTRWEAIDDAVTQPSADATGDYITSVTANATQSVELTAPADVGEATAATLWIYAVTTTDESVKIELLKSDNTLIGTASTKILTTTAAWYSHALTGLSLTQTDVDGLRLRFTSVKVGGGAMGQVAIRTAYVDLTYTVPLVALAASVNLTVTATADKLRLSHPLKTTPSLTLTGTAVKLKLNHPLTGTPTLAITGTAVKLRLSHPLRATPTLA
ncbi:MAG: hypothetical protein M3Q82_07545, partial [Actinomycetota bacterium]|nr:hypothetical protein [Actinomycetota bacterium]